MILAYGCLTTDNFKTSIPNNCAQQEAINNFLDADYSEFYIKLRTEQYNITSQQYQVNFKHSVIFTESNSFQIATFKTQEQNTKVKQGFIIQTEEEYSAPFQYNAYTQQFNNNNNSPYIQINMSMDDVIQIVQIQFPTFPEVLALVNSLFSILMMIGYFCRKSSQSLIQKDFFTLFMQNLHQDTYEQILKDKRLLDYQQTIYPQILNDQSGQQQLIEPERLDQTSIPQFDSKSIEFLNQTKLSKKKSEAIQKDQIQQLSFQKEQNQNMIFPIMKNNNFLCLNDNKSLIENKQQYFPELKMIQQINEQQQENEQIVDLTQVFKEKNQIENKQNYNQRKDQQKQQQQVQYSDQNLLKDNFLKHVIIFNQPKQSKKQDKINEIQQTQEIPLLHDYFVKKLQAIQNSNTLNQVKEILFQRKRTKSLWMSIKKLFQKNKTNNQVDFAQIVKEEIGQQVIKSLEIQELFKDIIFLKKSILLLLDREQVSAIKLVGFSPLNQKSYKNYFEEQLNILQSENLQAELIQKYFQRFNNRQYLTDLDKRIYSCITKMQII
ncbi:hypothetical protein TTHERM_01146100 (macronuclear) [Tetrahymena thermophila SB210]|uniref:AMP-binding enzyme family protein n=1 Tax=Tetrahymena thermophila (strain SB210) TaxID=312017 RepID=Q24F05_TETTS|nr:hypothetical protein TTHERM_01146100 [Tetrahymena thermophila SB210]EAS06350.2 hypothetical protein TTHERM_01146100 [Tetrahymena thermophila SB210]|eukprot:XP_001026595.2 hypothetical protein TTHERM_01146100 [Tetrahymena thermophila SB210]